MNPWISAVLAATGLTIVFAILTALVSISAVKDLARAARRFQDEVGGLAGEIGSEAGRASDRAAGLESPHRSRVR